MFYQVPAVSASNHERITFAALSLHSKLSFQDVMEYRRHLGRQERYAYDDLELPSSSGLKNNLRDTRSTEASAL
uniref:Uncharacterized protein n=1 Tax=Trichuris muris TaxID=70415 RepID=A0A5S6QJK7_TRIMR